MSNSYRIRTQVGVDKSIKVHLTQDFEFLEILSIKILESDIYTRQCSDYGVVIGRISINNGFGVPNCKVSIFVPLSSIDVNNPIISDLYPYSSVSDLNDLGYRYNLLPYVKSYSNHVPTGSFFDKEDVLLNQSYIEVFDKYYRYTAVTNESGDFMIFGVPLGTQTIHVDIDLSDIGEFSLAPQDLVRTGIANETQVAGTKFRSSSNLNELPQIISINRIITVEPLWGQPDICNIGINRTDFDLSAEANVVIQPTAIFMGSIFSSNDSQFQKRNCKPKIKQGELCNLVAGPGEILTIRQTIQQDAQGRPILEQFDLDSGGQVIDDNGTWLVDLPMNLDYVTTNEFGERVISNDPEIGIPTKGKYRFKIKWNQSPDLSEPIKRGYFLVPNIREYGWTSSGNIDPLTSNNASPTNINKALKSYAFSLDWDDYANPQLAIDCEDTFYLFSYNKVYTVSQLIDQYRKGYLPNRIIAVRNILDDACDSENVKFPTNDAVYRFDLLYLLFVIALYVLRPILYILLVVAHLLAALLKFFGNPNWRRIANMQLPNLAYPDCDLCQCTEGRTARGNGPNEFQLNVATTLSENAYITPFNQFVNYNCTSQFSLQQLLTGFQSAYTPNNTSISIDMGQQAPQLVTYTDGSSINRDAFTSSLPLFERINLFNTKAKYFDQNPNNPGGGWNRIAVRFRPTLNTQQNVTIQNSQYLNVIVNTGILNYSSAGPNVIDPIPFPNQTLQPTVSNPFNTNTYTAPNTSLYSVRLDFNFTFILPTVNYTFRILRNNIATPLTVIVNSNTQTTRTETFNFGLAAGDIIKLIGTDSDLTNTTNFNCNITMTINGLTVPVNYHLDNTTIMLVKPDKKQSLKAGTILSFQNPELSRDPNMTGATSNEFGTNGITGTSINNGNSNNPASVNVSWANPNGNGINNTTTYFINQTETDAQYAKYSMDIEYFQVVTAITVGDYFNLHQPEPPTNDPNYTNFVNDRAGSLKYRILDNTTLIHIVQTRNHCWADGLDGGSPRTLNPLRCYDDYLDQVIVIMVRGVDPYSSRGEVEYDLSILFGYPPLYNGRPSGQVIVKTDKYKLNIPIQGHYANTRHDSISNDITQQDSQIGQYLYYPSYHFVPSVNQFSGFTSELPSYYLSLSKDYVNTQTLSDYFLPSNAPSVNSPCDIGNYTQAIQFNPTQYGYIKLKNTYYAGTTSGQFFYRGVANTFTWELSTQNTSGGCTRYLPRTNAINDINRNRGYYPNEIVDGGSFMNQVSSIGNGNATGTNLSVYGYHYSPRYSNQPYNYDNCVTQNRIIMRSDRLPTSTNTKEVGENSFALQANELFTAYEISDDGTFDDAGGDPVGSPTFGDPNESLDDGQVLSVLNTFTCNEMVPLGCYYTPFVNGQLSNEIAVRAQTDSCYSNQVDGQSIMEDGCYVLITAPLDSLGRDLKLLTEWTSRIQITFAACRNVWSHIFTNNWINGSLYAFSFKNERFFDINNQPKSDYCEDTIILHPTNNFYYRSSPYYLGSTDSGFVGAPRPRPIVGSDYGGNRKNLKFPTTIVDLGPRTVFLQEITLSDEFDGYLMDKLTETSFKDVSEILNLLIINRLTNTSFLSLFFGLGGANVLNFFDKRSKLFADGDYSQMLSISSELGVVEFETSNYLPIGSPAEQDPIYFINPESTDPIFGIFFSSDTQTRDLFSPKRTIINPLVQANNDCAFNSFYVYSQEVPFYQWEIKNSEDSRFESIFGSQTNDWYTKSFNDGYFFSKKYQELDRVDSSSRYFRTNTSILNRDFKGYIYSFDNNVNSINYDEYNPNRNSWQKNNPDENTITVGAPFYFYFGLKKGKSAWDRFAKKWINFENIR